MAKTDTKSTALAETTQTAVINPADYEAYAGSGFENQDSSDYALPFFSILQALSPEVAADPEKFRQGMIINTVTKETIPGAVGIDFVPATTEHLMVEWKPRAAGGGFVGVHKMSDSMVVKAMADSKEYGKYSSPDGNDLIETFYVYGVGVNPETGDSIEGVLAFSSTKIKMYKGWMTKAKTIQIALADGRRIPAPLFAHRYRLKSASEKNNKGQFYNWMIDFAGKDAPSCRLAPQDPLFQQAVSIKTLIEQGKARADHQSQDAGGGAQEEQGAGTNKPVF